MTIQSNHDTLRTWISSTSKNVKRQPDKRNIRIVIKFLLIVMAIVSATFLISGINRPHLSPFSAQVETCYPTDYTWSADCSALLDSQGNRILIMNKDRELSHIIDVEAAGTPADRVNSICLYDGELYAAGSSHYNNGTFLSSEVIMKFDKKGQYIDTIYTKNYEESDFVNTNSIMNIAVDSDGVFLTCLEDDRITLMRADVYPSVIGTWSMPETICKASYDIKADLISTVGLTQNCYLINCIDGAVTNTTIDQIYSAMEHSCNVPSGDHSLDTFKDSLCLPSVEYNAENLSTNYVLLNNSTNESAVLSESLLVINPFGTCVFSPGFLIKNLLFWFSAAFAAAALILLILWQFRKRLKMKGKIAFAIVGGILLTSFFYTYHDMQTMQDTLNQNLMTQTKQMSRMLNEYCSEEIEAVRNQGVKNFCTDINNAARINAAGDMLDNLCRDAGIDNSCVSFLYLCDRDNTLYTFADSFKGNPAGQTVDVPEEIKSIIFSGGQDETIGVSNGYENYQIGYSCLYDNCGNISGVFTVCNYCGNLRHNQINSALNKFVTLLAIFIAIYISFSALFTFKADLKKRKKRDKSEVLGRATDLAGIFSFAVNLIIYVDNAIIVYVTASLCSDMSAAARAIITVLPITAVAVGRFSGAMLFAPVIKKYGEKNIAVLSSILTIMAMIINYAAICIGSIFMYIAGSLMLGFLASGLLRTLSESLSYNISDKTARKKSIDAVLQAASSAAIISILLSGYISEYLSYSAIYLAGTVMAAILLFVAFVLFKDFKFGSCMVRTENLPENPAGAGGGDSINKKSDLKTHWTVFLKSPMLMFVLFYTLPLTIMGGYKAYLFPLYSAGAGISVMLLSNLSVFSRALTYASNSTVKKITGKGDPTLMLLIPMIIASIGFMCFIISPNIYWAIITLFAFNILERSVKLGEKIRVSDISESYKLDSKIVQANYVTVKESISVIRTPILSLFVAAAAGMACSALGLVCGLMFSIYGIYSMISERKSKGLEPARSFFGGLKGAKVTGAKGAGVNGTGALTLCNSLVDTEVQSM